MHVRASTPWECGQSTVVGPAGDTLRAHPTFSFAGGRISLRDANGLHLHWFLPIADRMRTVR